MSVLIFGNGPMPNEPGFAVTAPGSRTWQIVRTVADGLVQAGAVTEDILVLGLDETLRPDSSATEFAFTVSGMGHPIAAVYRPLPYEKFKALGIEPYGGAIPPDIRAVVATGSVQPYATAAGFARMRSLPLWIDVFGDPICETQSQLELITEEDPVAADNKLVHVWKLLLDGLLQGDQFYALSRRQRHALQGELGCAGRLNQFTATHSICHYLPYAVFEDDLPSVPASSENINDRFTVMWSGSFNTWMDVPTLTKGITTALKANPNLHLLVVGGKIAGYNEISYRQFLEGIRAADVQGSVTLMDWQPLSSMQKLYAQCDMGISIDRFTYEAELGSRTRLVNFLAAGLPVASTTVTELSCQLAAAEVLKPFELGNAESLTQTLVTASQATRRRDKYYREYILGNFNGEHWGTELRKWIAAPRMAPNKTKPGEQNHANELTSHWQRVRAPLGS